MGSYATVVLACVIAAVIYTVTDPQPLIVNVEGFSLFAPLYIAAQAIERFLEPLAAIWGVTADQKSDVRKAKETLVKEARVAAGGAAGADAADAKAKLEDAEAALANKEAALANKKARRTLWLWAAASSLALLVCALLGLGLIEAVAKQRPGSEYLRTIDVLLTGLAVGAGTKPLHDLIARLETAKDNTDAASSPAATL
jgi:hypothetical protein